jgi:3-hydroxybutyryl-CoA dehydratase
MAFSLIPRLRYNPGSLFFLTLYNRTLTTQQVKKEKHMAPIQQPRGLYFEEFEEGLEIKTRGRTVTEADIVNFAGVSSDFNQMHTDAVYGEQTQFGQRVAHGLLGLSMVSGLAYQTGFLVDTVIAFTSIEWKFRAPIFIGDTIHAEVKVTKRREMKAAGGGFVSFDVRVLNQAGEVTQKGEWTLLIASQPKTGEE